MHGLGMDCYVTFERKVEGGDREEDEGDDQGQRSHHKQVNHRAFQAEEIGKAHHDDPPCYEYDPKDGRQSLLGFEQAIPPGVGQVAHILESLYVDDLLFRGGGVEIL